jgi:hypothetical protein
MTAKEFITRIQEYYGPYRKGQQREIAKYLAGRNEVYLNHLYQQCLYGYSSKWRSPPDIAVFQEFSQDALIEAKKQLQITGQGQIEEQAATKEIQVEYFGHLTDMLYRKHRYGSTESANLEKAGENTRHEISPLRQTD